MTPLYWKSAAGTKEGIIAGIKSLVKSALYAGATAALTYLAQFDVAQYVKPEYLVIAVSTIALVRALLTVFRVWISTDKPAPQVQVAS